MPSLGRFYFQAGSPYTLRAYWAILHSGVCVQLVNCIPIVSTFLLWLRFSMRSRTPPVSLPLLIPNSKSHSTRPLRESIVIARAADAMRPSPSDSSSLFPPRKVVELDKAVRWADTVSQYGRQILLDKMLHEPHLVANALLPPLFRGWFFIPALMRYGRSCLAAKYPSAPSRDDARLALESFRGALAKTDSDYTCGDSFSYADICMASCMYFAVERRPGSPKALLYSDDEFTERFSDLILWRQRMFASHCPIPEADAYKCLPLRTSAK